MKSNFRLFPIVGSFAAALFQPLEASAADAAQDTVDFRYSPPQWQTAICLPDDPQKSLVDKSGELLYHYGSGGREFGTRISVEVVSNAVWQKQNLYSPRVPIVRTQRVADGLQIVEEAFAVTDLMQGGPPVQILRRVDDGTINRNWAKPEAGIDPSLKDIALHNDGSIRYELSGKAFRVAIELCEGWWGEPGKRVQILRVEGAEPKTADTVSDIGKNKAAVFWFDAIDTNGDGKIEIAVDAADKAADKNTTLNGLWVFPAGANVDDAALLAGKPNTKAAARMSLAADLAPPRNDLILAYVTNTAGVSQTISPRLIVDTTLDCQVDDQHLIVNGHERISTSLQMEGLAAEKKSRRAIQLESLTIAPGKSAGFFVLYSGGGSISVSPKTMKQAVAARQHAIEFWAKAPLPYGRIQVPDAGIQALVDSSIRNIWQAREIKSGMTVFQVGPTCYRGLWIVDGAFLLEAATILGAGGQARSGVAYELTHQKPDGRIEVMKGRYGYWKENGIVLWTCVRHAMLTQDKAWLESQWPKLQRIAGFIKLLRTDQVAPAPQEDGLIPRVKHTPLDKGLMPHGIIDGGIEDGVEYTNPYWNLVGLHAFIEAARWLGKADEAVAWQKEYDDFMAVFRKAAARDTRQDANGNPYLPVLMGEAGAKELPQRAQWAFCHAVYPGQIFARNDPLVAGNMGMLKATEREGMVYGTGWDATGIWNYFASFYGHAWLWQGDGRKAAQILYADANHAAPVLDWREEQSLRGQAFRKVGDMPHNWASAEFIRLTTHLLALDRGQELHLLEGLPVEWTKAGKVTKLDAIATPFGKLTMELKISADGKSARLDVQPLSDPSCKKIVAHLFGWASADKNATIELDPKKENYRTIPLLPGSISK
jgi:hypothetical protein